jgi:high-affinity nickel-transport protein
VQIVLLFLGIGLATAIGFFASFLIGQQSLLLAGLGFVAYVFGLRHGVDADHIVAIDNTTRKLMQEDQRPLTVGTWFSLGHSTVVFGLILGLIVATQAIWSEVPALRDTGTMIGLAVSGFFLILIGLINVAIVLDIYRVFVELRKGHAGAESAALENTLNKRGFLNRFFRSLFQLIRKPWQIYPIGVLFGLGFDTASEVALIAISVGIGISSTVPLWMILILPFMFTCGMVLVDTTDGIAMRVAYGWALLNPIRKIYYNLTVTIVSVLAAFGIGGIEILSLLAVQFHLGGPFWGTLANLNFETLGFGIIFFFVGAWLVSVAYWKLKRYDKMYGQA